MHALQKHLRSDGVQLFLLLRSVEEEKIYLVADAHMKILREKNLGKVYTASLIDFTRNLTDSKRVLFSIRLL